MLFEAEIESSSRTRRTRMTERMRRLVRETTIEPRNLILPLFVTDEKPSAKNPIRSMPGVHQYGLDTLLGICEDAIKAELGGVILFGVTTDKDEQGSAGYSETGIVATAIRHIKQRYPELLITADVCLCEYTSHGHCGIIHESENGFIIENDETVELLAQEALVYAEAGADLIAPSDMMDGRVGLIRETLDGNGFENLPIMSYSAKYASGFYGPFRDAAGSTPSFGDRRSHQMDPANTDEALRVISRDIDEGADIIMVKPAMSYLDIIRRAKDEFEIPIAAYQVSGEYSMIKAAAANGWIDEQRVMMESLTSIKRAGSSIILTYFALEAAGLLK
ncbi:MAG TPA: porphobilinogen synthase [Candidatus Kapabacteria bacterium]|nr:porphobilinogen synthase [Candidatus Kapabacteria bacterium]